jgi:beta-lactamase class A
MLRRTLLLSLMLAIAAQAQQAVSDLLEQRTVAQLAAYVDSFDGVLGVAAIDLTTGRAFSLHGDAVFPQASSIKIPIMIEVFRAARAGRFKLDDKINLTNQDLVAGGRIDRILAKGPVTLTVRELVAKMIEFSDNTSTNKLIAMVGMPNVNRLLDDLGLHTTRLQRIMLDSAAARRNEENISTPLEMARLVEMLYKNKFADSAEIIEILKTVDADLRRTIPEDIPVAAKPGSIPGARCETGIVFLAKRPFAISVMSTFLNDRRNAVHDIAQIVLDHFEMLARSNKYGNRLP